MVVVCGYAPTAPGRSALRRAIVEAQRVGASVVVVNASRRPDDPRRTPFTLTEVHDLAVLFDETGLDWSVHTSDVELTAAEEVLAAARDAHADLVVIGVTGRRHVQKHIISTVTRDVLLAADCPVMTVRADLEDPVVAELARTDPR